MKARSTEHPPKQSGSLILPLAALCLLLRRKYCLVLYCIINCKGWESYIEVTKPCLPSVRESISLEGVTHSLLWSI